MPKQGTRLAGKTAVITGGASGIGRAIADRFAGHGARVHVVDMNADAAAEAVGVITSSGGSAAAHVCDVAKSGEVAKMSAAVLAGGIPDILVNSAGVSHIGTLAETTEADLDRVYSVNVRGMYYCMRAFIEPMLAAKRGCIVNIASVAGSAGLASRFAYSMSKGAVVAMSLSVARDYVTQGIRCNSISPARIHTPFVDGYIAKNYPGREEEMFAKLAATQPIGRMGTPDEVAALALYLCSDDAAFATGTDYAIDGGFLRLHG